MICRVTPFLPPLPPKKKGGELPVNAALVSLPTVRPGQETSTSIVDPFQDGRRRQIMPQGTGMPGNPAIWGWWLKFKSNVYTICIYIYIYVCRSYIFLDGNTGDNTNTFLEYEGWLEWGANKKIGKPIQKSFIWVATARCKNHCFHCCKNCLSELLDTFWICSVLLCCVMHSNTVTLPETNSSHLPQKPSQRKLVFQPRFFRGYVKLQGCTPPKINMSPERGPFQKGSTSSNHPFSGGILVFREGTVFHTSLTLAANGM